MGVTARRKRPLATRHLPLMESGLRSPVRRSRPLARGGAALLCLLAAAAADARSDADGPSAEEIHERVLRNGFRSSVLEMTLVSARATRSQPIRLRMLWRRYGPESRESRQGILSRAVLQYLSPPDLRRTAYLVVDRVEGADDQFVYLPSRRRIRRIHVPNMQLLGTDLHVADLMPRDAPSIRYRRLADGYVGTRRCYVLEGTPRDLSDDRYARHVLFVDPDTFVPLRVRYFDGADVMVKEIRVDDDSIREIDGHLVPTRGVVWNDREDSSTHWKLDLVAANPDLPRHYFSLRQLESRELKIPRDGNVRSF